MPLHFPNHWWPKVLEFYKLTFYLSANSSWCAKCSCGKLEIKHLFLSELILDSIVESIGVGWVGLTVWAGFITPMTRDMKGFVLMCQTDVCCNEVSAVASPQHVLGTFTYYCHVHRPQWTYLGFYVADRYKVVHNFKNNTWFCIALKQYKLL